MGRINNTSLYPFQFPFNLGDFVVGTDVLTGETKSFTIGSLLQYIVENANQPITGLQSIGNMEVNGDTITFTDVVYFINGVEYTVETQDIVIPAATDDFYRTDLIVGNESGNLVLVSGVEDENVATTPIQPANTALITKINVFGDIIQAVPAPVVPPAQDVFESGRTVYLVDGAPISLIHEDSGHFAALTLGTEGHSQLGGTVVELFSLTQTNFASADGITVPTVNQIKNVTTTVNGVDADTTGKIELNLTDDLDIGYAFPEDYGAVGDGIADDTAAIIACLAANDKVALKNKYLVSSVINLNSNKILFGYGEASQLITTSNIDIVEMKGINSTITNISFIGSGKDSGLTLQNGIRRDGDGSNSAIRHGNLITNCRFYNLGGAGYYTTLTRGLNFTGGALITGCFANSCNIGFFCDIRGEYSSFSNCQAINCNDGLFIKGGNTNWVGGQLEYNLVNFRLGTGDNDGHCTIADCKINHALQYNVLAEGVELGYRITNCDIYAMAIKIENCTNIEFNNCDIDFLATGNIDQPFEIINSTVSFDDCHFKHEPSVYTETNSVVEFRQCMFDEGEFPGITNYLLTDNKTITPNRFTGTDTEKIQAAIDYAVARSMDVLISSNDATGDRLWMIDEAILLYSNTRIIVDAKLKLSDTSRDNMFRTANCGFGITNPKDNPYENITIIGTENSVLEGADHPRSTAGQKVLANPAPPESGTSYGTDAGVVGQEQIGDWRNNMIILAYTKNFLIKGVTIKDPHCFCICLERCSFGMVEDIILDGQGRRIIDGVENQILNIDGVKIIQGGNNITFQNIKGHTDDNCVTAALLGEGYSTNAPGTYDSQAVCGQIYDPETDDIYNITWDNLHLWSYNSIGRILNTNGSEIHDFSITNLFDASKEEELNREIVGGAILFGSFSAIYGGLTPIGSCRNFHIENIVTNNTRHGIQIQGSLSESTITNVTKHVDNTFPAIYIHPSSTGVRNVQITNIYNSGEDVLISGILNGVTNAYTGTKEIITPTGTSRQQLVLRGTSGTANINIDGTDYLATFTTNLSVTGTTFISTHGATILSTHGVTVTGNNILTFQHTTSGFPVITITNLTGDLNGNIGEVYALTTTSSIFEDNSNIGLNYPASSSYTYTDKTLVPKEYVDDKILTGYKIQYPEEFNFRPFDIYEINGEFFTDKSNKDLVKDKIANMKPYYLDYTSGSNSNTGESRTTAFKTLAYALSQGARLIYLKGGDVIQNDGWGNIIHNISEDVFVIAEGSEPAYVVNNLTGLSFSIESGTTYQVDISSNTIPSVVDFSYVDSYNKPLALRRQTSLASVNATENSFAIVGTTLYINLKDGRVPDSDIFVMKISTDNYFASQNQMYFYGENICFMGGGHAFAARGQLSSGATGLVALMNNCSFMYGNQNGFAASVNPGIFWLEDCIGYMNGRDGFNYSQGNNYTTMRVIEVNCQGFENGTNTADLTSALNGSSIHNDGTIIRVNGKYYRNVGPNVADVNGALSFNVGIECFESLGFDDSGSGGAGKNWADWGDFAVGTIDTEAGTKMWLYACKSGDTILSYFTPEFLGDDVTPDTSVIYVNKSVNRAQYGGSILFGDFVTGDVAPFSFPTLSTGFTTGGNVKKVNNTYPDINGNVTISIPTVDAIPTDGSSNTVSSNGVFDALASKANLSGGNGFSGTQNITDSNTNVLGIETTSASMATQRNALKLLSTTSVNMNDGFGVSMAGYIKDNAAVENFIGRFGWERAGADNTGKAALTVVTTGTEFKVFDITQSGGTFYSPITLASLTISSTTGLNITGGGTGNYLMGNGQPSGSSFAAAVRGSQLTGFSSTTGTVTASDTVLTAFNKLVGNQDLKAPILSPYVEKTSAYTILTTDRIINCTSGTFTLTLPTAAGITGKEFIIKNSGAGLVTVDGNAGETIDGNLTEDVPSSSTLRIVSNGTNYVII